eukprot:3530456-Pyramimonas_sp.AAC.1
MCAWGAPRGPWEGFGKALGRVQVRPGHWAGANSPRRAPGVPWESPGRARGRVQSGAPRALGGCQFTVMCARGALGGPWEGPGRELIHRD